MAATPSRMIPLGTSAPDFALPDPAGRLWRLADFGEHEALLVLFACNHCPYVKHLAAGFAAFARDAARRGVAIVAINSNDVTAYPEDRPERMAEVAREWGWDFPYLFDSTQEVARAYGAACTPDFFLFDRPRHLVYRGQFDDSRPGSSVPVTGHDLRAAVDQLLAGRPLDAGQRPSLGCNIKWKPEGAGFR